MSHGVLKGTFYVPNTPQYVTTLDFPASAHTQALVNKFKEVYPIKFASAVFETLNARVTYNVDAFVANGTVNPATNPALAKIG